MNLRDLGLGPDISGPSRGAAAVEMAGQPAGKLRSAVHLQTLKQKGVHDLAVQQRLAKEVYTVWAYEKDMDVAKP